MGASGLNFSATDRPRQATAMKPVSVRFNFPLGMIESLSICILLCLLVGCIAAQLGLFGSRNDPIARIGGAVSDGKSLYVARYAPAAIYRFDLNEHLLDITPLDVSPIEMTAIHGKVILTHSGREYHPDNLRMRDVVSVPSRQNVLGHPYVWDQDRQRWVALQPAWLTAFQMWPAIPLCLMAFAIGVACRFLRTGRNPFDGKIKRDRSN
jgi:hypothetical protein